LKKKKEKRKKKKVGIYPLLPTNSKTISCKVFSSDSSTQQQNTKQTLASILTKNHLNKIISTNNSKLTFTVYKAFKST
jgi:hypothetical protein